MRLRTLALLSLLLTGMGRAQTDAGQPDAAPDSVLAVKPGAPVLKEKDLYDQTGILHPFTRMPRYVVHDQGAIWTSPFHTKKENVRWWLLIGGATGALIAADKSISEHLPRPNSTIVDVSNGASRVGSSYSVIPITAGMYFVGAGTHDEKLKETGLLAFESLIDVNLVAEGLKMITDRARPYQNDGKGRFEDNPSGRWSSGFPSGHAINTWALASVISHEYPHRKIVPILAYGLAATVSVARVGARQHFPSDVVAGSAMGWFIGDYVYGRRHNSEIGNKAVARILDHVRIGGM